LIGPESSRHPSGNLVTGTGIGSVADTDTQDATTALTVAAVGTGAEGQPNNGTVGTALTGQYGSLTLNLDGSYSYAVDNNNTTVQALHLFANTLQDIFHYSVQDTGGLQNAATLTVTIHGADDLPQANADTGTMIEDDAPALFNVKANDTLDPDSTAANTIAIGPGTVTVTGPAGETFANTDAQAAVVSGQIQVTLGAAFQQLTGTEHATVTVPYTLTGDVGETSSTNLVVTVNGVNDVPVAQDDTSGLTEDAGTAQITVLTNDTLDADHGAPNDITVGSVSLVDAPSGEGIDASDLTVSATAGNQIQVTLGADFQHMKGGELAHFDIPYTLHGDQPGDTSTATLHLTVSGANDNPVAADFTFNGSNAAIGNTALVVDDPTDGAPDPAGPQKTISGDLLAAATDPDTPSNLWTITAGTVSNASGSITFETDGDFTYLPAPGFIGDAVFNYTLNDNDPSGNQTDTGQITINVATPKIWYVDNTAAPGGDGTSDNPFDSLADVSGASGPDAAGDIIYLFTGSGDYTGGITLLDNQTLWGAGEALVVNGTTLAAAGTDPVIANAAGNGVTLASGNTLKGFTVGNTSGFDVANTAASRVGSLTVSNVDLTGTGGLFRADSGGALNVTFDNASTTSATGNGIDLEGPLTGSFTATSGAISGVAGTDVLVSGGSESVNIGSSIASSAGGSIDINSHATTALTFSGALDITGGNGINIVNTGGTITFSNAHKVVNTGANTAVNLNTSNVVNFTNGGLDIDTTSGTGLSGNAGALTLNVTGSGNSITTTTGTALNLSLMTVGANGVTFDSVSTNGAANGILLDTVGQLAGSSGIDINGGSIVNASTRGVDINATSADVSIASTISSTAAGRSVEVTNSGSSAAGGSQIAFSGLVTDPGLGINLDNNDQNANGATVNFSGGLNIDSTTQTGFNAVNGGTVNVTGSNNSLNTTTGTALNIANTTIGANNVTFHDISSNGGSNSGIILSNTGSSGGLHVTGNGSNVGATGGGVIANKTGSDGSTATGVGIYLNNTSDVQLNGMDIQGNQNYGIRGVSVTGFTLDHSTVGTTAKNGTSGTVDVDATSLLGGEASLRFNNLTGTASISNSTLDNGYSRTLWVQNTTDTLNLSISNSTINESLNSGNGGDANTTDAVFLDAWSSAAMNLAMTNSHILAYRQFGILGRTNNTSTMDVDVSGSEFANANTGNANASAAINLGGGGTGSNVYVTYNIHDNTFRHGAAGSGSAPTNGGAQIVTGIVSGSGTFDGRIVDNTFGVSGVARSGAGNAADVLRLFASGNDGSHGHTKVLVQGNTIQDYGEVGIQINARQGNATIDATVIGNTIREPGTAAQGAFGAIWVNSGALPTDTNTVNIAIGGTSAADKNTMTNSDPSNATDVFLDNNSDGGAPTVINLYRNGSTAAGSGETLIRNILVEDNNATLDLLAGFTNGSTIGVQNGLPPQPSPLLAAPGGVQASSPTPGETHLTQAELDSVVAAAIAQWAHAGASASQLAAMHATVFSVEDLAGTTVGEQSPGLITIDVDAAGHGWFVDPTPNDNSEFTHAQNAAGTDLLTDLSNAAAGHLDLLTTVTHELGHVIGLGDTTSASTAHDLMYINLVDGERRVPDAADVALADASGAMQAEAALPLSAQAMAGTPVISGTVGNDTIDAGLGGNILFGGAGADNFVFGPAILQPTASAPAAAAHIADYSALQGDTIDVSALLGYAQGMKVSDAMLAHAQEDASGGFATLQVNTDAGHGGNWVDIAQLDGVHAGDVVNVVLDPARATHQIHAEWLV
jgi:VCBS repeat-containing protein